MDLWIAATAIVHDLILETHNMRDFEHVPDLSVTDWTIP
jgi:predicted nucleic acid-binding protein